MAPLPARVLIAGTDLLASTLANALKAYGFATRSVDPSQLDIGWISTWNADLVIVDARSLTDQDAFALVAELHELRCALCVIDMPSRTESWRSANPAGVPALIDPCTPFDQLFRVVTRLLRPDNSSPGTIISATSWDAVLGPRSDRENLLQRFDTLSERESVVLSELMDGHCAEEIARDAIVSISTVRSQIKSILQKLGVNSQLAAVALARRADWSHDLARARGISLDPGRRRVS